MNKPVYLGLLIYEISETLMYEFWHDCNKPKNWQNTKLCYMDTDIFVILLKLKIFMKTLQMMMKKDSIHQIMKSIGNCLQE